MGEPFGVASGDALAFVVCGFEEAEDPGFEDGAFVEEVFAAVGFEPLPEVGVESDSFCGWHG